jgi:hypothetical protein
MSYNPLTCVTTTPSANALSTFQLPTCYCYDMNYLHSPAQAVNNITTTAPVKYQLLSKACTAPPCSSGSLSFRLLNLRDTAGYAAVLYRGGVKAPVATAVTETAVTFTAAVTEVMHVHLALTGVPSEMRVLWVTGKVYNTAYSTFSVLQYTVHVAYFYLVIPGSTGVCIVHKTTIHAK